MVLASKTPGSIMLMGEHAVLHGSSSLVLAIDKYIYVKLTARTDACCIIDSNLGQEKFFVPDLKKEQISSASGTGFFYIKSALFVIKEYLPKNKGINLTISSEFSAKVGFGSSAAVIVGVLAVVNAWLNLSWDKEKLLLFAKQAVIAVQGVGSGADVASSIYGNIIKYRQGKATDIFQDNKGKLPNITAVYCGYKEKTATVIDLVAKREQQFEHLFDFIWHAINQSVVDAEQAIKQADWVKLGQLFNCHHGLQSALGVSNTDLATISYYLRADKGIYGAKISGSGLGDCVIGLGSLSIASGNWQTYNLSMSTTGVTISETESCSADLI